MGTLRAICLWQKMIPFKFLFTQKIKPHIILKHIFVMGKLFTKIAPLKFLSIQFSIFINKIDLPVEVTLKRKHFLCLSSR